MPPARWLDYDQKFTYMFYVILLTTCSCTSIIKFHVWTSVQVRTLLLVLQQLATTNFCHFRKKCPVRVYFTQKLSFCLLCVQCSSGRIGNRHAVTAAQCPYRGQVCAYSHLSLQQQDHSLMLSLLCCSRLVFHSRSASYKGSDSVLAVALHGQS